MKMIFYCFIASFIFVGAERLFKILQGHTFCLDCALKSLIIYWVVLTIVVILIKELTVKAVRCD